MVAIKVDRSLRIQHRISLGTGDDLRYYLESSDGDEVIRKPISPAMALGIKKRLAQLTDLLRRLP
jgi:hypothetical protein